MDFTFHYGSFKENINEGLQLYVLFCLLCMLCCRYRGWLRQNLGIEHLDKKTVGWCAFIHMIPLGIVMWATRNKAKRRRVYILRNMLYFDDSYVNISISLHPTVYHGKKNVLSRIPCLAFYSFKCICSTSKIAGQSQICQRLSYSIKLFLW